MWHNFMPMILLLGTFVNSKPVGSTDGSNINEIDHGTIGEYKNQGEDVVKDSSKVDSPFTDPIESSEESSIISSEKGALASDSTRISPIGADSLIGNATPGENPTTATSTNDNVSTRNEGLAWFLAPLAQKFQFSPQAFIQERFGQLAEKLNDLGLSFPNQKSDGKTILPGGLAHLVGSSDSSFYSNRLDPAGFFGGNGWFANKGGILGGPGAFLSTGSLLTDYPTPYKK